jgi:CRP-like cAMP-binding protein
LLLREGAHPDVAYVTLNGAVEEALGRGQRRIRIRLAGPGRAVGYVGLVDGRPSPVTVATRERALLLAVPRAAFADLFEGATALSFAFVEAVERDLVTALRQAERPQARLAASRPRA